MPYTAIQVEKLSKVYVIGRAETRHDTFASAAASTLMAPVRNFHTLRRLSTANKGNKADLAPANPGDILWALKEVSFNVRQGTVLGIVGRNGAGKSTLLKVLSRITRPTSGRVVLNGRVSSLLEVGTGFHPELTGRENVYLNGTILGMRKSEIDRKFEEIVDFAGVEAFLDTPVKRYSSGMGVRLAFSVAAHLEPEILLVDEVLAVGDAAFQRKCLGKMGHVAKEGRTILFVSHDMSNISVICDTAMWLHDGQVRLIGESGRVIEAYMTGGTTGLTKAMWTPQEAPGDDLVRLAEITVRSLGQEASGPVPLSSDVELRIEWTILRDGERLNPVLVVRNAFGAPLFSTANYEDPNWGSTEYRAGSYQLKCVVPAYLFNDGRYHIDLLVVHDMRRVRVRLERVIEFAIFDDGSSRGDYVGDWIGLVRPRCKWSGAVLDRSASSTHRTPL